MLAGLSSPANLSLSLDFEIQLEDSPQPSFHHRVEWYMQCLYRRLAVMEALVAVCPSPERCAWVQLGVIAKQMEFHHPFVVVRSADGGYRAVKAWLNSK